MALMPHSPSTIARVSSIAVNFLAFMYKPPSDLSVWLFPLCSSLQLRLTLTASFHKRGRSIGRQCGRLRAPATKRRGRRTGGPSPLDLFPLARHQYRSCAVAAPHCSTSLRRWWLGRPRRRPGLLRSRNIAFGAGYSVVGRESGHMRRAKARWLQKGYRHRGTL